MNRELIMNKFVIILWAVLFILIGCENYESDRVFCENNLIITDVNYEFFVKNHEKFLRCKYISLMRMSDSKVNTCLELMLKSDSLVGLSISFVEIATPPKSILQFKHLESLELSNCKLKKVPDSYSELRLLKSLKLEDNNLSEIPYLESLKYLNISNNEFKTLPYSYFNSNEIESIYLDNNKLSNIHLELIEKRNLNVLSLSGNNISSQLLDSLSNILGDSVIKLQTKLIE